MSSLPTHQSTKHSLSTPCINLFSGWEGIHDLSRGVTFLDEKCPCRRVGVSVSMNCAFGSHFGSARCCRVSIACHGPASRPIRVGLRFRLGVTRKRSRVGLATPTLKRFRDEQRWGRLLRDVRAMQGINITFGFTFGNDQKRRTFVGTVGAV